MGGNAKGKRSYTLVVKKLPGEEFSSVETQTKPNEIWLEINQIFQGLYDANPQLGEELMRQFPKGAFILEQLPEGDEA